jgi:hypothetical protein
MIKKIPLLFTAILLASQGLMGQVSLKTRAELSDYQSTSEYKDVIAYIEQLKSMSPDIRVEKIATSAEGRDIPLLIIGRPVPASPEKLANDPRIVVYVQANIHAGEVEGKEAALAFARDLLADKKSHLLDHVILLICPIYNPDGNEKISTSNRSDQNGPVNGVGVRYNGLMLDLNRDAMKAESPEMRGLLANVFNKWDPYIFMDCHTTDGSFHVEPVTFTWMANPNTDNTLISYLRDSMMPEMSVRLLSKYKVENCFYGEFEDMLNPEKGWVMDASEPRYLVNYYGLRNRLGILNENYIYADFKSRVLGCYSLIRSLVDYADAHYAEIKKLVSDADRKVISRSLNQASADSFAVEYKVMPAAKKVTIKTYEAEYASETDGWRRYRKTDRQKTVTVPYFIDYYPVRSVKLPFAYLLTVNDPEVVELLQRHGIMVDKLTEGLKTSSEKFDITDLHGSARLIQGHYMNTLKGKYSKAEIDFPAGTIVIRMAQPLANLAAYLLEPESNDGLLTWNFLDRYLVPQWGRGFNPYPVCRIMNPVQLKTEPVNISGN